MKITVESKSGSCAFQCGDNETILYAGLRQGLKSSCMNVRPEHVAPVAPA